MLTCIMLPVFERQRLVLRRFRPKTGQWSHQQMSFQSMKGRGYGHDVAPYGGVFPLTAIV